MQFDEFAPESGLAHRFFANLLPEGRVRDRTVRNLKISGTDFDLLRSIGGECAGALTILQLENEPSEDYKYFDISDRVFADLIRRSGQIYSLAEIGRPRLSLAGA